MKKPMKIVVRSFWDHEAKVWCGIAEGGLGLATEAPTLDDLYRKLPIIAEDLLEGEYEGEIEITMMVLDHIPEDD
jgi:hypothetical protein